jgi:hypothetical protein
MSKDTDSKFVRDMLDRAKDKSQAKPQSRTEGMNNKEIEQLTENIRNRIQQKDIKKQ